MCIFGELIGCNVYKELKNGINDFVSTQTRFSYEKVLYNNLQATHYYQKPAFLVVGEFRFEDLIKVI